METNIQAWTSSIWIKNVHRKTFQKFWAFSVYIFHQETKFYKILIYIILVVLGVKRKIANSGQLRGIFIKPFSFSHFSKSKCCSLKVLSGKRNAVLWSVHWACGFILGPNQTVFACQYICLIDSVNADTSMDWNRKAWRVKGRVTKKTKCYHQYFLKWYKTDNNN